MRHSKVQVKALSAYSHSVFLEQLEHMPCKSIFTSCALVTSRVFSLVLIYTHGVLSCELTLLIDMLLHFLLKSAIYLLKSRPQSFQVFVSKW